MRILEFIDAETGKEFAIPARSFIRVNELENEERCEVWYEEAGRVASQIVNDRYEGVVLQLEREDD